MANIFDIDWNNVVENLTPYFWRTTNDGNEAKMLANWRAMIKPVQDVSDDLLTLQTETVDFLQYTGQHKVLEEYLNNLYDNTLRRIFITENNLSVVDPNLYQTVETDPVPLALYQTGEVVISSLTLFQTGEASSGANFTVNIPSTITYDTNVITAQLRNYVEAAKTFDFVTF